MITSRIVPETFISVPFILIVDSLICVALLTSREEITIERVAPYFSSSPAVTVYPIIPVIAPKLPLISSTVIGKAPFLFSVRTSFPSFSDAVTFVNSLAALIFSIALSIVPSAIFTIVPLIFIEDEETAVFSSISSVPVIVDAEPALPTVEVAAFLLSVVRPVIAPKLLVPPSIYNGAVPVSLFRKTTFPSFSSATTPISSLN